MNPFSLAYREQQQLFIFDRTYILGTLFTTGGLATLVARFIVQFFHTPGAALAVTLVLLALSTALMYLAVSPSRKDWPLLLICLVPAILLGASLSDNALHYDSLIAWLLCAGALAWYSRPSRGGLVSGCILTSVLYLAAGPGAIFFALSAFVTDAFRGRWRTALLVPLALAWGLLAWYCAWVPDLKAAWTPVFYYDIDATMPSFHHLAWLSMPVCLLLCQAARSLHTKPAVTALAGGALAIAAFIPSGRKAGEFEPDSVLTGYEYEYYTVNGRWDDLVRSCRKHDWSPRTANYLNLGLAWQGRLCEDLLKYDQRGTASLIVPLKDRSIDVASAHIMFAMGNMAAAQDIAFNTLVSLNGYCPAMLKMNALIELMRGSYDVADKYLSILEKAPRYRSWARRYKAFLNDDEAVEADPLLGGGRRGFDAEDGFALFGDPLSELLKVLEANPSDGRAVQYALSYLLLSRDLPSICSFIGRFYGSEGLPALPAAAQEALLFYSEYSRNFEGVEPVSLEWCYAHGLEEQTAGRFLDYQNATLANGGTPPGKYRGTYWYYLLTRQ